MVPLRNEKARLRGSFATLIQVKSMAVAHLHRPGVTGIIGDMKIYTIGYEGATQPALIAALHAAGVVVVADVRAVPLSRRPGFSKNVLAAGLQEAGIGYAPFKPLGTPPEGREAARRHDHAGLAASYDRQLDLPEAIVAAEQLKELMLRTPTALLCFERDPHWCHRTLLIAAIMPDAEVVDLYVA